MKGISPIPFRWDGAVMCPSAPAFARRAAGQYVEGETYVMLPHQPRSSQSHKHYFAALETAWKNLPEDLADQFPEPEHLRKRALIDCGYFDEEIIDCGSNSTAAKIVGFIRKRDDFALIFVRDQFLIIRTAKSQSKKAMGKVQFQKSKQDCLDLIASMVGVSPEQLSSNAGRAA